MTMPEQEHMTVVEIEYLNQFYFTSNITRPNNIYMLPIVAKFQRIHKNKETGYLLNKSSIDELRTYLGIENVK